MFKKIKDFLKYHKIIIFVNTGIKCVCTMQNGNKYVHIMKVKKRHGKCKTEWKRKFLVEHIVDDNLEVTDDTLEQEKHVFVDLDKN